MPTEIKKWGNSAAVRNREPWFEYYQLSVDTPMEIWVKGKRLAVQPLREPAFHLDGLLQRMTADSPYSEFDFDPAAGVEVG